MIWPKQSGDENGIKWVVDPWGDIYVLATYNEKTGEICTKPYHCQHRPISGLDIADAREIERILDEMITAATSYVPEGE